MDFFVYSPGGNITGLVEESVPESDHAAVAKKIMDHYKDIEQVGFLSDLSSKDNIPTLRMMGGEFCCNATRSAGFHIGKKFDQATVFLRASGAKNPLSVSIEGDSAKVTLPGSFFVKLHDDVDSTIIDLQGIRHIIIQKNKSINKESLVKKHRNDFPAVGAIEVEAKNGKIAINPFVWVRETDTFVAETGCGSGSIAVAIAQWNMTQETLHHVIQPSGEIYTVTITGEKSIDEITLTGVVTLIGKRTISL